jgi:hypothetical protein
MQWLKPVVTLGVVAGERAAGIEREESSSFCGLWDWMRQDRKIYIIVLIIFPAEVLVEYHREVKEVKRSDLMEDLSKRTIIVLLLLVVLSSLISTWAFISSVNAPQRVTVVGPRSASSTADLQLEIKPPAVSSSSADLQLEVTQPKGG